MSKFDVEIFRGDDYTYVAVSKERYSKEEAIEIAKGELKDVGTDKLSLVLQNGFARHRAGINEDGDPCVGWWLEWEDYGRNCPVYAFRNHWDGEYVWGEHEILEV